MRDLLEQAIKDRLVSDHWQDESEVTDPQELFSSDLVGCANLLNEFFRKNLEKNESETAFPDWHDD